MTGEKNRFKTTEKLWDLDDKQLKTPVHDALVLWLMDEDNLNKILQNKTFTDYVDRMQVYDNFWVINYGKEYMDYDKNTLIRSEVPLTAKNGFVNGYADLIFTELKQTNKIKKYDDLTLLKCIFIEILIEVKPHIDSFGAVLRQINSYKKFSKIKDCCLFTLDTRFDKQFESQGIHVLHPPKEFNIDQYMKEMRLH